MPEYLARYILCKCDRKAEFTLVIDDSIAHYCEECVRKMVRFKYPELTTDKMSTDELMTVYNWASVSRR
jgi:hypothetical protein